jgi:predicted PurR-regulated permease PerM
MSDDIKNLANNIAQKTTSILKSEKANKFFRIGFFVVVILLFISIGLTIHTRIVKVDNPLRSVVNEQQEKIDDLTKIIDYLGQLNQEQQDSITSLEEVDSKRSIHIENIKNIIQNSVSSIQIIKDSNEKARQSFQLILKIVEELEKNQ